MTYNGTALFLSVVQVATGGAVRVYWLHWRRRSFPLWFNKNERWTASAAWREGIHLYFLCSPLLGFLFQYVMISFCFGGLAGRQCSQRNSVRRQRIDSNRRVSVSFCFKTMEVSGGDGVQRDLVALTPLDHWKSLCGSWGPIVYV